MFKRIFKSIMLVSAVVLALGLAFVMGILYYYFGSRLEAELRRQALYLSYGVESQGVEYLENVQDGESRLTYVDPEGEVLYDSDADVSEMENHSGREEIREALRQGAGQSSRISETLAEQTIYFALRLDNGNVLRVSGTRDSVLALLVRLVRPLLCVLLVMLLLSGLIASKIARKLVEPINSLDLEHPEENQTYEEISPLLSALYKRNRMIEEQLAAAGRQQEEFSVITENMQEALLVIDRSTMILSGNSSAWKLFKVREPKTGESIYSLSRSEEFRRIVSKALSGRHKEVILKLDGKDMQLIANPVTRDGKTEGAVLLLMNVTERVERESLRREFSANVSHELKTPLTSISGFAEIIQSGYVKEEDIRDFAGRIYNEAQRLITLVQDVIRLSQLDEMEIPYEWGETELYQLSKEVCGSLRELARQQKVHLYIGGSPVSLYTVRPIMEEIVYNLCENAIKYNREDGTASILLAETADSVSLTVKDTGIGIPREDQGRIFERFFRVDKSHSKEIGGTGLGLSIVKHGVAFLGGTLEMESEEGLGTSITVTFPKPEAGAAGNAPLLVNL